MPDERLAELLRQRALLSQHVAWLDAEIARASSLGSAGVQPISKSIHPVPQKELLATPAPVVAAPAPAASLSAIPTPAVLAVVATNTPDPEPVAEPVSEAVALANKRADEIIANYAATDSFNPESTRRGCMLLASAVFLIGAATLIGIYLLNYR